MTTATIIDSLKHIGKNLIAIHSAKKQIGNDLIANHSAKKQIGNNQIAIHSKEQMGNKRIAIDSTNQIGYNQIGAGAFLFKKAEGSTKGHATKALSESGKSKYRRLKRKWQSRMPWLCSRVINGKWGVGCKLCARAGCSGAYGRFSVRTIAALQMKNFMLHETLDSHKNAVTTCMHQTDSDDGENTLGMPAPPYTEFKATWDACKRHAVDDMHANPNTRHKFRMKRFCLAEGVRMSHRTFLKTATCATVAQDATGNTMVARFISSNHDLDHRQGILGLQRNYGSGHKAVLEATKQMCTDFMTPLHGAPVRVRSSKAEDGTRLCHRQPEPVPDQEALQHLRDIVRLWCADAAGDEQLAGREAGPLSGSLAPFFPNLELVLRDTAHASRRLIEFSV